jgi:hypothetical protein
MKRFVFWSSVVSLALGLVLLLASAVQAKPRHKHDHPRAKAVAAGRPQVLAQEAGGQDRLLLTIRNPLPYAIWVYLECPSTLTQEPVGFPGHTTAKVNLVCPVPPGGRCVVNHWERQTSHSPRPWSP